MSYFSRKTPKYHSVLRDENEIIKEVRVPAEIVILSSFKFKKQSKRKSNVE